MLDLREHIKMLDEKSDILVVKEEVNWQLDAAAFSAMGNRTGAQAIWFKNVVGYPGMTLAANLLSGPGEIMDHDRKLWDRLAIALGLDPGIGYGDLIKTINDRTDRPIRPVELSTGPCKEVVLDGDDADVLRFPIPFLHQDDGGRYGTSGVVVTKDPDSVWQNWGYIGGWLSLPAG